MFKGGGDEWSMFSSLVRSWGAEAASKTQLWYWALSGEQKTLFAQRLLRESRARLSEPARLAVVALLLSAPSHFPAPLLRDLAPALVPPASEAPAKRRRLEEDEAPAEQAQAAAPSQQSLSLSLSVPEEEEEEENEIESLVVEEQEQQQHQQQQQPQQQQQEGLREDLVQQFRDELASAARRTEQSQSSGAISGLLSEEMIGLLGKADLAAELAQRVVLDEARLGVLVSAVLNEEVASARSKSAVLKLFLLPRVLALDGPPSRQLLQTCGECVSLVTRLALSELLVPAVSMSQGRSSVCELVGRVLDEGAAAAANNGDLLEHFIGRFVVDEKDFPWTDSLLALLLKAVSGTAQLSDGDISALLEKMMRQVGSAEFRSSVRTAKLLQALASRRPVFSATTLQTAKSLASQLTSFLAKNIVQKLAQ